MLADDPEAPTTIRRRFDYGPLTGGGVTGSVVDRPGLDRVARPAAARAGARRAGRGAATASAPRATSHLPGGRAGARQAGVELPDGRPEALGHRQHARRHGPAARLLLPRDRAADAPQRTGHRGPGRRRCPGAAMYILIGRTQDYAWSLTSANHDVRDVFAEQLCNPDGTPPTRDVDPLPVRGHVPAVRDVRRRHAERHADPLPPVGARAGDRHRHRRRQALRADPAALDVRSRRPEPRRAQGHDRGQGRPRRGGSSRRPTSSSSRSTGRTRRGTDDRLLLVRAPARAGAGPRPAPADARHRRLRVAGLPAPSASTPTTCGGPGRPAAQLEQPVGARLHARRRRAVRVGAPRRAVRPVAAPTRRSPTPSAS